MNTQAGKRQGIARQPGFTLAEVLVAIAILVIGIIVVLKIFPSGFNLFNETQQTHQAIKIVQATISDFEQDPLSVPDEFEPVDYDAGYKIDPNAFQWGDIRAVDYVGTTDNTWSRYLYPVSNGLWPLWQPLSTRVFRRVIGERCMVPAQVVATGASAINVALLPKYILKFGPIFANGQWNATANTYDINSSGGPITIYDTRYHRVTDEALDGIVERLQNDPTSVTDRLYYAASYQLNTAIITTLPFASAESRTIRFSFYVMNTQTREIQRTAVQQDTFPAAGIATPRTLPFPSGTITYTSVNSSPSTVDGRYTITFVLPAGWTIIPGSEQINRAYVLTPPPSGSIDTETTNWLQSGEYYIDQTNPLSMSAVYFSPEDAGKTLKIDYTIADWNILHEDLTVDADGYLTLAVPDPKIRNKPVFPRESTTWGLFEPLKEDGNDLVMGLVDLQTGMAYGVTYKPGQPSDPYVVGKESNFDISNPLTDIDMSQAERGRIRVGGNGNETWSSLAGTTFRVYYRATRDWTVQVLRPPAIFTRMPDVNSLGWSGFAVNASGTNITVPAVYEGQSVAADYYTRDALAIITAAVTNSSVIQVDSTTKLLAHTPVAVFDPGTGKKHQLSVVKVDENTQQVTLSAPITLDPATEDATVYSLLKRVSGEVHIVPPRDMTGNARPLTLRRTADIGAGITVRGVSVLVRALWVQPRHGLAWTIDDALPGWPTQSRDLNEQWQAKDLTITLPTGKD